MTKHQKIYTYSKISLCTRIPISPLKKNEKTVCYEKYNHLKTLKPQCEAGDQKICQQMKEIRKTLPTKKSPSGSKTPQANPDHICIQAYQDLTTQEECLELYKKWKEYKGLCNKPNGAQYCKMATKAKEQLPFDFLVRGIMDEPSWFADQAYEYDYYF